MELQFEKQDVSCLRCVTDETFRREETGEVRLPENMPDAAGVIAAWGQVILRGKEWRNSGMTLSGGVMAWVLYASEDTGEMHWVDTWIPLQFKGDFPDPGREGQICAWGSVDSVDARVISARKIMVRANVTLSCRAWVKERMSVPKVEELPEDVHIRENTYPVKFCREAGEQSFALEEDMPVAELDSCIYYGISPRITEHRVMGDKLVYRGICNVHMLGSKDGKLRSWDGEMSFSQFAELEESYEQEAEAYLQPVVTSMEMDYAEDGKWTAKCAIACQYVVTDREMLTIPEDGYSTDRETKLQMENVQIPCVLQMESRSIPVTCAIDSDGLQVLDATMQASPGWLDRGENMYLMPLWSQVLYMDAEGKTRAESCRWEEKIPMQAGENVRPGIFGDTGELLVSPMGSKTEVSGTLNLWEMTDTCWEKPVLSGMELGENAGKDPNRPSLILRRMGKDGLWEMAKSCRTTVSAIEDANDFTTAPAPEQMVIIPIS